MKRAVYTVNEVAEILGVTKSCVYDMIKIGKIKPVIKIGLGDREVRIPYRALGSLFEGGADNADSSTRITD